MNENGSSMTIVLTLRKDSFQALAHIECPGNQEKAVDFLLNDDFKIHSATADAEGKQKLKWEKTGEEIPVCRPLSQRIQVSADKALEEFWISYEGSVQFLEEGLKNWANVISDDLVSLSIYSVWYPQEMSVETVQDKVILENGHNWVVIKGTYDSKRDVWEYGGEGYDPYNIMAYRKEKLKTASNPFMNVYFLDESMREAAEQAEKVYGEIIQFYNGGLFQKQELGILDIACAFPALKDSGGYRRKDFMWCTELSDLQADPAAMAAFLAHETAHVWCQGADGCTWEDWLNETTAEWSALLFALQKKDQKMFDLRMKPKLESCDSLPPIKTSDGSRPEGVHEKGTVLFYRIYQICGCESVRRMVRIFADLECKNTEAFLQELESQGMNQEADMIREGLTR